MKLQNLYLRLNMVKVGKKSFVEKKSEGVSASNRERLQRNDYDGLDNSFSYTHDYIYTVCNKKMGNVDKAADWRKDNRRCSEDEKDSKGSMTDWDWREVGMGDWVKFDVLLCCTYCKIFLPFYLVFQVSSYFQNWGVNT